MKTVLFIIYPIPSHFLSSFPLANEFKNKKYRVVYGGLRDQKKIIENGGYTFIEFFYSYEYKIRSFSAFFGILIQSFLRSYFVQSRYRELYKFEIQQIEAICNEFNPEIVFIDEHLTNYYFGFVNKGCKIIFLNTKLSTARRRGIPPLNSSYIPTCSLLSNQVCNFLWFCHLAARAYSEILVKIAFLGYDDNFYYDRICRKRLAHKWRGLITNQASFYKVFKNSTTVILASQSIEFFNFSPKPTEHYINLPILRNEEHYISEHYIKVRDRLLRLKPHKKIIFCTFGMISSIDFKRVEKLLKKIINAVGQADDLILMITTGGVDYVLNKRMSDTYIFDYIPQLDVLKYCDVVITHGGLTTIKECMQNNVPMLIFPINRSGDTSGNSARVVYNKFGLRGKIESDSEGAIRAKLGKLLYGSWDKVVDSSSDTLFNIFPELKSNN